MPPALLGVTEPFFMWAFSISADDKRRATPPAEQPTWDRLDIPKDMSRDQLREEYWTVKDNVWPSTCFVTLNGHPLELRRKIHHGKDLPLDLTHYVIEGINTLEFSLLQAFAEVSKKSYAVAVERVEVGNTNRVRQAVGSVAAEDALASILSTLQARQDDEDLILVDPHLSVEVTDPFSSRIFDIPVRSVHCLHKECFDLEIFLASRKSRTQGAPTNPDEWKCPICRCDARPMNLVIDGFLEHVRQTLETLGALDTKAILVQADGTWTSKEGGDTSDSHSRKRDVESNNNQAASHEVKTEHGAVPIVIELDD
ncbi:putative miz zinc finger domain protein [Phaeomoniella chlamydospora]|uniref:Putative miz zinc finger domain protein n=1 Tax=Phaeomoniella chlamydospora TaxID=158046 RepID=A0A0G2DU60_PHACM|nr:putative miz zinc finger domain protein [Phaeomoniella chlamydospora]